MDYKYHNYFNKKTSPYGDVFFVYNLINQSVMNISNIMVNANLFAVVDSVANWSGDSTTVDITTNEARETTIE